MQRHPQSTLPALVLSVILVLLTAGDALAQGSTVVRTGRFEFSPGDRVVLSVWPDSTLGGIFPIEPSGVVHLPLLGERTAAGKTVDLFREELRQACAMDLQLPVVSLEAQFRVSILGAVQAPGVFWVDPSYGVFELISAAGGMTDDAQPHNIVISRASGERHLIDADRLQFASSPEALLDLRAGDRLVVPRKRGLDWRIVLQSLTLVATIVNIAAR